jgi:hypothetical protein
MGSKSKAAEPAQGTVTSVNVNSVERYVMKTIRRSQITNAPWNPRVISDSNRSRLKKGIKKKGLLGPIEWNERSGNVLGGHQRLSIMDQLVTAADIIEGSDGKDYWIRVAASDMNDIEEVEANLLLNNPKAQGEFTLDGLSPLMQTVGLDLEASGFDPADAFRYGGGTLEETIASIDTGPEVGGAGSDEGPIDKTAAKKAKESLTKLRDAMNDFDKSKQQNREQNNPDFYFLTVFRSSTERDAWLEHLGLDIDRFQSAVELADALRSRGVPPDADADQPSDAAKSAKPAQS